MHVRQRFTPHQIQQLSQAVTLAEERVSDAYKLSTSQWLRLRYDIRTLRDLGSDEITDGPLAQILRYRGQKGNSSLGSASVDLYRICLQDHAILAAMERAAGISLLPFATYIMTHELIHVVRFGTFQQAFETSRTEAEAEEQRVHRETARILAHTRIQGLPAVIDLYADWQLPLERLRAA
jgi:hypothetical protein